MMEPTVEFGFVFDHFGMWTGIAIYSCCWPHTGRGCQNTMRSSFGTNHSMLRELSKVYSFNSNDESKTYEQGLMLEVLEQAEVVL